MRFFPVPLCLLLFFSAEAQQPCMVEVLKEGRNSNEIQYVIPTDKNTGLKVNSQGTSWVEVLDKDGLRRRFPKATLEVFRNEVFAPGEMTEADKRSTTRKKFEAEQAESAYRDFLENYYCGTPNPEAFNVFVEGRIADERGDALTSQAVIKIYSDGDLKNEVNAISSGEFSFSLEPKVYTASFEAPGYISKKLMFDGRNIPAEEAEKGFTIDVEMTLWKPEEGVDYSLLEEIPVGLAAYDKKSNTFAFDNTYTQQIRNLVDHLDPANQ